MVDILNWFICARTWISAAVSIVARSGCATRGNLTAIRCGLCRRLAPDHDAIAPIGRRGCIGFCAKRAPEPRVQGSPCAVSGMPSR